VIVLGSTVNNSRNIRATKLFKARVLRIRPRILSVENYMQNANGMVKVVKQTRTPRCSLLWFHINALVCSDGSLASFHPSECSSSIWMFFLESFP
jgi:hypothetical protein